MRAVAALDYIKRAVAADAQTNLSDEALDVVVEHVEGWLDNGGELDAAESPPLRVREGERLVQLAAEPPLENQAGSVYAIPGDLLEVRTMFVDSRPLDNPRWVPLSEFRLMRDLAYASRPVFSQAQNKIYTMPAPDSLELLYYSKIPSLLTNESNYVFDNWKKLYIEGVIARVAFRNRSMTLAGSRFNTFLAAVRNINMTYGAGVFAKAAQVSRPINPPGG